MNTINHEAQKPQIIKEKHTKVPLNATAKNPVVTRKKILISSEKSHYRGKEIQMTATSGQKV